MLPVVFFATLLVAVTYIVISGKNHIEVAQESATLVEEKAALKDSVVGLACKNTESLKKLKAADSTLTAQVSLIKDQQKKIVSLDKETKSLKAAPKMAMALKPEIIYIHDTVFITEKKNFWGKTKKTVTSVQSIDSVFREEPIDSL